MSSPPEHNIPLDPLPELAAALKSHEFGVEKYTILEDQCFPVTQAQRAQVAQDARDGREVKTVAVAEIVLLKNEGSVIVGFDSGGYKVETTTAQTPQQTLFESLDALLIALSPAYVDAMNAELKKRLAGGMERRWVYDDDAEEPEWID